MEVLAIGEALIDLLSSTCLEKDPSTVVTFTQYAGGAPANVAVAVAKLGGKSFLFGKVGKDQFGHFLINALKNNGVSTDFVGFSETGKTALAFVSLDHLGERSFEFYDTHAAHNDIQPSDFTAEIIEPTRVVSFCSGMLANEHQLDCTLQALEIFKKNQSIICLDINFRSAFWPPTQDAAGKISSAAIMANIIKASRDELVQLYGVEHIEQVVKSWIEQGVSLVIITDGGKPIAFYTQNFDGTYPAPKANVVDTTAAGDAFVGGFLYRVAGENSSSKTFVEWVANFQHVLKAIDFATKCGAFTVAHFGAFDSLPIMSDLNV